MQRKLVGFVLVFFLFFTASFAQSKAYEALLSTLYDEGFPTLKPTQINKLSDYQVLDAREQKEFEVSHLPEALWVGYDTFTFTSVGKLKKDQPVLIYCTVGARSQEIGKRLQAAGFSKVYNLYGGILQWANDGRELISQGKPTTRVHTYSKSWGIWLNRGEKVY